MLLLALEKIRGAEIAHFNIGAAHHQNVRGFDVAVDDALAERVIERATAFKGDLDGVLRWQELPRRGVLRQVSARNVLDRDVAGVAGDRGFENRGDMRMRELAGKRSLIQELHGIRGLEIRTFHQIRIEYLQGNLVSRERVQGKVDRPRGALTQGFQYLKFADLLHEVLTLGKSRQTAG